MKKEKFLQLVEENPSLLEIDIIIGSDLLFNSLGLQDFSNLLSTFKEVYLQN
jgi:hypothetical protein